MNNNRFIKSKLEHLDYMKFYDVAIYFLQTMGHKDISVVDGINDKGIDVITSKTFAQIQLSTNKDWENKINRELENAFNNKKQVLMYITNRRIPPEKRDIFREKKQKYKDKVELIIYDLDYIATHFSRPEYLKGAYSILEIDNPVKKIDARYEEIAISTVMLLSNEAKDLRENILETHICFLIYKSKQEYMPQESIINNLMDKNFIERDIEKCMSKLLQEGKIINSNNSIKLSEKQKEIFISIENQLFSEIKSEKQEIKDQFKIDEQTVDNILNISLEIISRVGSINLNDEESLSEISNLKYNLDQIIIDNGLGKQKRKIYEIISKLKIAKINHYREIVKVVTRVSTYDIYRILSRNTNIKIVLDTSVAMPMLFALEFGEVNTKFVKSAQMLLDLANKHDFELVIPAPYVGEIAGHGYKISDIGLYENIFKQLNEEDDLGLYKRSLGESRNAFISFFAHYINKNKLKIEEFLDHFGINLKSKRESFGTAINAISDLFDNHGIKVIQLNKLDNTQSYKDIEGLIENKRNINPSYDRDEILIKNDADVCTYLKDYTLEAGFIFATWDTIIPQALEKISRVYAANPARVMDLLSITYNLDSLYNHELFITLLYSDQEKLAALAEKIVSVTNEELLENNYEKSKKLQKLKIFNENDWQNTELVDEILNIWN